MSEEPVRTIVIVGGGTAGWMTAAMLSRLIAQQHRVLLVESDEIGTVGVGEATIPQILLFNRALQLDENEFLAATGATFKLGIMFDGWTAPGHSYIHTFGKVGRKLGVVPFHHYWLRALAAGKADDLAEYSLNGVAAYAGKFGKGPAATALGPLAYAYHFDASLYAAYLRRYAEERGVERIEGKITDVRRDGESGFVRSVKLADGRSVEGDLFVDCSGFRGLLIEQVMEAGFEDWSHWLPCDRAMAIPSEDPGPPPPYTRAIAREAGWQWRIPLQHRTGNGYVYCSRFISDERAAETLLANLPGKPLRDPRPLKFVAGRRKSAWVGNVVSIGLSSGFLEPLESTSIHLIQTGVARLIDHLPGRRIEPGAIAAYNRASVFEYEHIRDFLVLHYWANGRVGEPFWDERRSLDLPDTLAQKIDLFRATGRVECFAGELFQEFGWLKVMIGQGIMPEAWHPLADNLNEKQLEGFLAQVRHAIDKELSGKPTHQEYLQRTAMARGSRPGGPH